MSDRITVIHAPRDSDHQYFALSRSVPQDNRLSFEARGVLAYLLSKPSDWMVRPADLQREGGCGRDRIYRILKELKEHGYLHRDRVHKADGTFEWGPYRVYEIPFTENTEMVAGQQEATQPFTEKPYTEKPDTVKPYTENPHIYKRESSTDQRVIQKRESESPARTPAVQTYFDSYPGETLNAEQVADINRTVADLVRWQEVLHYWKVNGHRPQSILKMLDRYRSGRTVSDDRPASSNGRSDRKPPALPSVDEAIPVRPELSAEDRRRALARGKP